MGAWGSGVKQNDVAMDFLGKIIDFAYGEAAENEELLVVAELCMQSLVWNDDYMLYKFKQVVDEELHKLDDWCEDTREARKKELLDLQAKLDRHTT